VPSRSSRSALAIVVFCATLLQVDVAAARSPKGDASEGSTKAAAHKAGDAKAPAAKTPAAKAPTAKTVRSSKEDAAGEGPRRMTSIRHVNIRARDLRLLQVSRERLERIAERYHAEAHVDRRTGIGTSATHI